MGKIAAFIGGLAALIAIISFVTGKSTLCGIISLPGLCPGANTATPNNNTGSGNGNQLPNSAPSPESNSVPAAKPSLDGPWSNGIPGLELTVTRVEVSGLVGDRKLLRYTITVNNDTDDSLQLPLFGSFSATDDAGQSYAAEPMGTGWPQQFPPRSAVNGTIDLKDSVPTTAATMTLNFAQLYGSLQFVGKAVGVSGIPIP